MQLVTRLISSLEKVFPDKAGDTTISKAAVLKNEPFSFQVAYIIEDNENTLEPIYIRVETDLDESVVSEYSVGYVPVVRGNFWSSDDYFERKTPGLYPDMLLKRITNAPIFVDDNCWKKYVETGEKYQLSAVTDSFQSLWFTVNEDRQIFGWDTDATGNEYAEFLDEYISALKIFLKEMDLEDKILFHISDEPNEEFRNRPTRVLKISRETKTINAYMNCGANLDAIPEYCITVGMKEIFMAKKIIMIMPRDWNAGALRKILHGEITAKVPCSLFREHKDATIYTLNEATKCPIPEIRVYNK